MGLWRYNIVWYKYTFYIQYYIVVLISLYSLYVCKLLSCTYCETINVPIPIVTLYSTVFSPEDFIARSKGH